jgi:formate/nitrite transporter FocA (FNT family)
MKSKQFLNVLLRSFMTGVAIALGGTVFLSCENKIVGAFLFGTGLFVILNFGFYLYTGKVGYIVEKKISYAGEVALIWLGNFLGTFFSAILILHTRISSIAEKAKILCDAKSADGILSILILAFFCGMLMFIAADGFKSIENPIGKIAAIFLPVVVFILSGFEHCVANMFYFSLARAWNLHNFLYLLLMTLGNALGGIFIPLAKKGFVQN